MARCEHIVPVDTQPKHHISPFLHFSPSWSSLHVSSSHIELIKCLRSPRVDQGLHISH